MKIRLIATDLDGTLMDGHDDIPAKNLEALKWASQKGIKLAIASGRTAECCSLLSQQAGLDCAIISSNGAQVLDAPFGTCLSRQTFAPSDARTIVQVLLDAGCIMTVSGDRNVSSNREFKTQQEQDNFVRYFYCNGHSKVSIGKDAMKHAVEEDVYKILAWCPQAPERLREASEQIKELTNATLTSSWINNIEIMPHGIDKGSALASLCKSLGIPSESVMAIGDNENDHTMLEWAGHSVAMGNAVPSIKALCRYQTLDYKSFGVAEAIYRIAYE